MKSNMEIVEAFLNAYLSRRSAPATLKLLTENVCWVGCGQDEQAFGIEAVGAMLRRDMEAVPTPFIWSVADCHEAAAGADARHILITVKAVDTTLEHGVSDMRVSLGCVCTNGVERICAVHASVPTDLQESGTFFPVSHAEKRLKQNWMDSQQEMTVLMESVQAGIAVLEYRFGTLLPIYYNEGVCRILNASREEVLALYQNDAYAGVHPDDRQRVIAAFEDSAAQKIRVSETYRLSNQRDEYAWVSVNAVPVTKADGRLYYYVVYTDITQERKLLEEARVREESINVAVEQTGINIWTLDLDTRVIFYHRRNAGVFHLSESDSLEDVPESFIRAGRIHPEDVSAVRNMYAEVFSGKRRAECAARWKSTSDGEYRWLKTVYTTVRNDAGRPTKAVGSVMDITEQMKMEQRYRDFEAYQYLMLDHSFGAFKMNVTRDTVEEVICCSDGIGELAHAESLTMFCSLSMRNIPQKNDRTLHRKVFSRENLLKGFDEGRSHVEMECRYQLDGRTCHWVKLVMNLAKNPSTGDIVGFTYADDINDEKLMEFVVDNLLGQDFDLVLCIDGATDEFRVLEQTKTDRRCFGSVRQGFEQHAAALIRQSVHPDDRESCLAQLTLRNVHAQLRQAPKAEYVMRAVTFEGTPMVKRVTFSYLDESDQTILYTQSDITKTVTEQNRLNEQLKDALKAAEQASMAKSDFLARMSHDMRTPMNGIIGLTSLALDTPNLSPEMTGYLQDIETSGQFLLSLINDTLDMNKMERNMLCLNPQPVHAKLILDDILAAIRPMLLKKQISFVPQFINTTLGYVRVDRVRLQQVILNVLSNSVKFTPVGGKIELVMECLKFENNILHDRITIRDNGVGMSAEFLPKLFLPFEQEQEHVDAAYAGTGLGMPIVKSLVEAMGGSIEVKSTPGVGTEISMLLDFERVYPEEAEHVPDDATLSGLAGKRILLCEDHPINMQISRKLLEKKGMRVTTAQNGQQGVAAFASAPPNFFDAVLMDIRMPVMDGLQAARAIRALPRCDAKTVPILAMTANAYDADRERSRQAGMNAHLAKPIEVHTLYETLNHFIGRGEEKHEQGSD